MADAAVPGPRSCCGAADTGKQGRRGHREDAAASGARGAGREAGKRQPQGLVRAQGEEGGSRRPSRGFSAQHCASPRGVDADETVAPAGSAGRRAELPGPEPRGHVTPAACGRLRPPGAAPTSVLDALSSTDSHLSPGGWPCRTPTCSGPGGRQLRALKLRFKASTAGRGPAWSGKRLGVFRRLCAHPAGPGQAPAGRPGRAGVSCGVGRPRGASVSHLESPEGAERSRGAHLQPSLLPPPTVRTPRVQGEAADDSQDWQGPPRLCPPVPVTVLTPAGRGPSGHLLPMQGPGAVSAGEGHTAQQPPRVPHGPLCPSSPAAVSCRPPTLRAATLG